VTYRAITTLAATLVLAACASGPASGTATVAATAEPTQSPTSLPVSSASQPPPSGATPSPSSSVAPAEVLQWRVIGPGAPSAREDHTWTVDPSREVAYLFGGRDGATVYADLWAYELATGAWSEATVAGGPDGRFGHEAVWADGVGLVVFGGQAGATFFNDVWAYDPGSRAWTELPASGDVPAPRYGTCSGIGPDGRLWISHGFTSDGTRFSDTVAYDFASGEWTDETPEGAVPVNRCLHGCWWTADGALALYAGQTTGVTALGDLWLLADGDWSAVQGDLPPDRNLFAHARLRDATLVFGGQAVDNSYLADIYEFGDDEPVPQRLRPEGPAPQARSGATMIFDAARDRVLLFGGRDAAGALNDLWALDGVGSGG
jgi:hypothetical protein